MYTVTKTYGAERGLSAAFRQWRAKSHCRYIHGYALAITLRFGAAELNEQNWVIDFGDLGAVKSFLERTFDHTLCVASDDPDLDQLASLAGLDLADVRVFPHGVGCEKFAEYVFGWVSDWLSDAGHAPRVRLLEVEVREHSGNAASVEVKPCHYNGINVNIKTHDQD
jgi:6-pyruvoyltetrahydropterin/6-carboxytetrahydropterin synthase